MSGQEEEHDAGEELCESDEAKIKGAAGERINLPADGDSLHLRGRGREEAPGEEEAKAGITECDSAVGQDFIVWGRAGRTGNAHSGSGNGLHHR